MLVIMGKGNQMQREKKGGNEYEMSVLWSSGYAGDRFQTGGGQQRHPKKKILR